MVLMDDDDLKKVSMTFSENRLDLYTTDKKYGDGLESLGCESPGFSETLLVTGTFITEALRNYTTEKVVFELRPSGSPQRTQPLILTDGEHVNVIMPLRV
jgi:DNA polymerase III sliding clamp (beta) subunit (PCNA family)